MKKEISDHLAKAFFERKGQKKQAKEKSFNYYIVLSLSLVVIFVFVAALISRLLPKSMASSGQSIMIERHGEPYTLKYNFSESISNVATLNIDMPDLDYSRFRRVAFVIRLQSPDARRLGSLKVSIVNKRKETSSQYFSDIDSNWKKVVLPISAFQTFSTLSGPITLSFTLEPWNVYAKKGELLIDDIELLSN